MAQHSAKSVEELRFHPHAQCCGSP
jgi:hypothetical protein